MHLDMDKTNDLTIANDQLDIVRTILQGQEQVVSHPGASQYESGVGFTASGLAALNCARVLLGREQEGIRNEALLQNVASRETTEVCLIYLTSLGL
jgi:hypothetical protein